MGDDVTALAPEEITRAGQMQSSKRRSEYLLGRAAAQDVLTALGYVAPPAVERGKHGEPLWPLGVIGSLAHSKGVSVAVAAKDTEWRSVGIDLEPLREPKRDLLSRVGVGGEFTWSNRCKFGKATAGLIVFSIKESIYKALFPLVREWFGFKEVEITLSAENNFFTATVLPESRIASFSGEIEGGFHVEGGKLLSWTLVD